MRRCLNLLVPAGLLFAAQASAGELSALLRESLQHPAVRAAEAGVTAAREQLSAERSRYFGAGSAFVDTARFEDRRFVGTLSPDALAAPPFARDQSRLGFGYELPVDLSGAIAASRRAAEHELAAARLIERQVLLLKLHGTLSAYVQLQTLLRQQEVLQAQRQRVQQTVERVTRQVEIEQASIAELRLAQAELARLHSDDVRLAGAMDQAQAAMEESSGRRLLPASAVIGIPAWRPEEDSGELLPVVLAGERAARADSRARAARRALWPRLSAGADYTQFEVDGGNPDIWSLSAKLSVPIDPSGWKRADAAQAQADAAVQERLAARREAQRDLTALIAAYQAAAADAQALETEVEARSEVVRVQAELQRVGLASLEEFLRQQRDLLDAESRRTDAQARAVVSWSAIQVLQGASVEGYVAGADPAADAGK